MELELLGHRESERERESKAVKQGIWFNYLGFLFSKSCLQLSVRVSIDLGLGLLEMGTDKDCYQVR